MEFTAPPEGGGGGSEMVWGFGVDANLRRGVVGMAGRTIVEADVEGSGAGVVALGGFFGAKGSRFGFVNKKLWAMEKSMMLEIR